LFVSTCIALLGVTGPLIDLLKLDHMQSAATIKMVTEINWLFAFLTAKEDATVSALIDQGLIEVHTSLKTFSPTATFHSSDQLTATLSSSDRCS
jgi:hypothetical protein